MPPLDAGYVVRCAFGVTGLRSRGVAGSLERAVNRVAHVLVPVRVGKHVVAQNDRSANVVTEEAHPEPVETLDARAALDGVVLDGDPRHVERSAERACSTLGVDAAVDVRVVDL